MRYGIDQREADEIIRIVQCGREQTACSNPTEKCPACPRWMKDCEGLDEYNEILENVDCGWK